MISLLVTVIAHLANDADLRLLVGDRIASKHRFSLAQNEGWPTPSAALQLQLTPGARPDQYAGVERGRLECRCYGASQAAAEQVYLRLAAICQSFTRQPVTIPSGEAALLYWIVTDSTPSFDRDPETHVDYVRVYLSASVHTTPV